MNGIRLVVDPLQSIASGTIDASYMGIGPVWDRSARMVLINNHTNAFLLFSYDGITDHFTMLDYSSLLLTITNNDEGHEPFSLPALSRLYVKQLTVPTHGSVYVTHFRGITDA